MWCCSIYLLYLFSFVAGFANKWMSSVSFIHLSHECRPILLTGSILWSKMTICNHTVQKWVRAARNPLLILLSQLRMLLVLMRRPEHFFFFFVGARPKPIALESHWRLSFWTGCLLRFYQIIEYNEKRAFASSLKSLQTKYLVKLLR